MPRAKKASEGALSSQEFLELATMMAVAIKETMVAEADLPRDPRPDTAYGAYHAASQETYAAIWSSVQAVMNASLLAKPGKMRSLLKHDGLRRVLCLHKRMLRHGCSADFPESSRQFLIETLSQLRGHLKTATPGGATGFVLSQMGLEPGRHVDAYIRQLGETDLSAEASSETPIHALAQMLDICLMDAADKVAKLDDHVDKTAALARGDRPGALQSKGSEAPVHRRREEPGAHTI